ncbi:MAG TPA: response regulator [Steroidobacteraceae bacterium]|nr:response regulator [Steroidobacteraceae bacterium]
MKRVLFVDEDTSKVAALRRAFGNQHEPLETVFVSSGAQALAELALQHFDAIVSDMCIPQMDGAELLATVRERHPEVIRLCVGEADDDEAFLRAVPVTHQFLRKPCNPETVREVIDRACSLAAILHDPAIRQLISRLDTLPATPHTYQQLAAAIARPTSHTHDISEIVSNDRALCVKTLQIVNSALFRRNVPITSIPAAITYVGLEMLKSLALSACVFTALEGSPHIHRLLSDMQDRSLRKARFAHSLLDGEHGADEAFTAALLLDVGQAVLALGSPDRFEAMIAEARERSLPWQEVEAKYLGASHPEVGACLLGLWGLPLELIEAVAHHHRPSVIAHPQSRMLAAIHVADAAVDATMAGSALRLSERLDATFVQRPEIARQLSEWHIDVGADTRLVRRLQAL